MHHLGGPQCAWKKRAKGDLTTGDYRALWPRKQRWSDVRPARDVGSHRKLEAAGSGFSSGASRRNRPCWHLEVRPARLISHFCLWSCERVNFRGFRLLHLWRLVMAAKENCNWTPMTWRNYVNGWIFFPSVTLVFTKLSMENRISKTMVLGEYKSKG